MPLAETPSDAVLRREIRRAVEAELFDGLTLREEMQAQIQARIKREADRRSRRLRSLWTWASVAAAVALTFALNQPPTWREVPPVAPVTPITQPADEPTSGTKTTAVAPGGNATDSPKTEAPPTGGPAPPHSGPTRIPFGVEVRATGGIIPAAGALPEFLLSEPVVVLQPGSMLPLRLTWHANENGDFHVDPGQTQWEIVDLNGGRERHPLGLTPGTTALTFSTGSPLPLDVTVQAPQRPGWYNLFLTAHATTAGQTAVQGAGTHVRLFIAHPAGTLRTGDVAVGTPAASATRDGITLRIERVQMTELMTEVDYQITLPAGMYAPVGHNTFLRWDGGGEWVDPVTVGEREGPPGLDGHVHTVTGQAIFPPTPRAAGRLELRVPSLHVIVPTGGPYGSVDDRPGPWIAGVELPAQP